MPFAYPEGLIPDHVTGERAQDVFWCGNKMFGLRKLYTDYLAEARGIDFDQKYPQDQFAGHAHLKRYHTNTMRAKQMLAQVEACVECPALTASSPS